MCKSLATVAMPCWKARGIEVNWPEARKIETLTVNWREVSAAEVDVMVYWKTKSPIRLARTPS